MGCKPEITTGAFPGPSCFTLCRGSMLAVLDLRSQNSTTGLTGTSQRLTRCPHSETRHDGTGSEMPVPSTFFKNKTDRG
eukprot:6431329-Amphidinium_carterae.1